MKFRILIQEYLGYRERPRYGKAKQLTIETDLNLEELRDKIARELNVPIRDVGRPKEGVEK